MKENKNKIILLICIVVITIIFVIANSILNKRNNNVNNNLEKSVEEIGERFYKEYLYLHYNDKIIGAIDDKISIMVPLKELFLATEFSDEYKFEDTVLYKKCDLENSTIIYTPYAPMKEENFDIEVFLSCEE